MENEKTAIEFLSMEFKNQESIISACMMNHAKYINDRQDGIDKKTFRDAVIFLSENKTELFNESYLNCLEMLNNEKYNSLPLALFVSKACGKALNRYFYMNSKSASEKIDDDAIVNCSDSFDSFKDIFEADRIESIINQVRDAFKAYARNTIAMVKSGFTFKEIAKYNGISENRQSVVNSAIVNAIAIVNAEDREWNIVESIIASDRAMKDSISRRQLEKRIVDIYYLDNPKTEKAIDWKEALQRLKAQAYFTYNSKALKEAFYK